MSASPALGESSWGSPRPVGERLLLLVGLPELVEERVAGPDAAWLLPGAPAPVDAGGAARAQQLVVAVTLVLQARAVLDGVDEVPEEELAHRAHLEHLAVGDLAGVRAVVCEQRERGVS